MYSKIEPFDLESFPQTKGYIWPLIPRLVQYENNKMFYIISSFRYKFNFVYSAHNVQDFLSKKSNYVVQMFEQNLI